MNRVLILTASVLALLACSTCAPAGDPRHSAYPTGAHHYRLLEENDFCGELPLFARPEPEAMIGTILDGAQRYVDVRTGREFRAISVLTVVNHHRIDRWYRREKLVGRVYVLKNDPRFNQCSFRLDQPEVIRPLSSETAAD